MSKPCRKECEKNKICNPETGRCVLRNGAKGKEIQSQQKPQSQSQQKPQPQSQQKPHPQPQSQPKPQPQPKPQQSSDICKQFKQNPSVNPRSGRKISNTGKVYKDLVKECESHVSPPKPRVSPAKPHVSPPKPHVSPPKPHVSPPKPHVSPPKPRVSPAKPHVSPPKPHVSPAKPHVSPPKPHVSPAKPHVSPPKPQSLLEDCGFIGRWWNGVNIRADIGKLPSQPQQTYWRQMAEKAKIKIMGDGHFGTTYIACKGTDCNYIVKIQENKDNFIREVNALYDLNGWEHSPIIYDAWTCGALGFIVMEKLDHVKECIQTFKTVGKLKQELNKIVDMLHERGWVHADIHLGNLMCKNGKFALLDFGESVKLSEIRSKLYNPDRQHPDDLIQQDKNFMRDTIDMQIQERYFEEE
jgi:hypothetical protein